MSGKSSKPDPDEREEQEINRIIDERMAEASPCVPWDEVMAETLARDE